MNPLWTSSIPASAPCLLHLFHQPFVCRDVGVVPDPPLDVRGDVGRMVDLDLLRAHDGPAAFSLDAAHDGVRRRVLVAHAVAVGNLEEPVASRDRPDLHGLEEDVESWFPHRLAPSRQGSAGRLPQCLCGALLLRIDERDLGGDAREGAVLGLAPAAAGLEPASSIGVQT